MFTRLWLARSLLCFLFLGVISPLSASEITLPQLLSNSPAIAVLDIKNTPPPGMHDKPWDTSLAKQQADATLIQLVRGKLPPTFIIENEGRSVLSNGRHVAFLKRVSEGHYVLSSSVSLRRIDGDNVYWFPRGFIPLDQALAQIK